uniref:Putative phosphoribosyltransferase C-terminal n=1 Tax=Helianthus annuus TaxID=4232 RepID=A0A251V3J2_HELAN
MVRLDMPLDQPAHDASNPRTFRDTIAETNPTYSFPILICGRDLAVPTETEVPSSHGHLIITRGCSELRRVRREFDTFPTSKEPHVVRMRYDRLRSIGGRIQNAAGDLANQGERFHSLLSWRDPRASALFVTFCLVTAIVLYVIPFQVVALLFVFYVFRHQRFRTKLPSIPATLQVSFEGSHLVQIACCISLFPLLVLLIWNEKHDKSSCNIC